MPKKNGNITRKKACSILSDVIDNRLTFDEAFNKHTKGYDTSQISNTDKAFIYLLCSSVFRYLTQIDHVINFLLTKPIKKLPNNPKMALRIGIAQIFILKTPHHAAVNTSVNIVTVRWRGLVNAVMRNLIRDKNKYKEKFFDSPKIPKWLLNRWKKNWPNDYVDFVESIQEIHPHIDIAVKNNLKKWQKKLNARVLPNNILRLKDSGIISNRTGYQDGEWWVQDYSSQLAVKCLKIKKGEEILDLCAAPGGKTAQMISLGAEVVSVDQSKERLEQLNENMNRLKFSPTIIVSDILKFKTKKKWNKILLDVPCLATGTIRKNPDIMYSKNDKILKSLIDLQKKLLKKSWSFLNTNGLLIYCNCSLEIEEGEIQIQDFLKNNKNCEIDKISPTEIDESEDIITSDGWLRILTKGKSCVKTRDGFFIARLKKTA